MDDLNCIRCGRKGCDGKNEECHAPVAPNTSCCVKCSMGALANHPWCQNPQCDCHQSSQSKGESWETEAVALVEELFIPFAGDTDKARFLAFISKLLSERKSKIKSDLARIIYGAENTPDMILGDVARYLETVLSPN